MKYKILRGILIAGVVLGFGSGFAQVGAHWAMHRNGQHPHWSKHCRDKDRDQATPDKAATPAAKPAVTPNATTEAKPAPTAARTAITPAPAPATTGPAML
jgi:hypothetical protein